MFDLVRIEFLG